MAGALIGAKKWGLGSLIDKIVGAYIGGVAGSTVSDLLNAGIDMSKRNEQVAYVSREEKTRENPADKISAESQIAELRGIQIGVYTTAAMFTVIMSLRDIFEEAYPGDKSDNLTKDQVMAVVRQHKQALFKNAHEVLLNGYSSATKKFECHGIKIGLNYFEDKETLEESLIKYFTVLEQRL